MWGANWCNHGLKLWLKSGNKTILIPCEAVCVAETAGMVTTSYIVRTVDPKLFKNLTWQCFFCCLMRGEGFNEMPCSDWWRIFSYLPVLPIEIIFISCIVGTFKPRKRGSVSPVFQAFVKSFMAITDKRFSSKGHQSNDQFGKFGKCVKFGSQRIEKKGRMYMYIYSFFLIDAHML